MQRMAASMDRPRFLPEVTGLDLHAVFCVLRSKCVFGSDLTARRERCYTHMLKPVRTDSVIYRGGRRFRDLCVG